MGLIGVVDGVQQLGVFGGATHKEGSLAEQAHDPEALVTR